MDSSEVYAVFLFTDIEGSTRLWQTHGDRLTAALTQHDAIIREAVTRHGGRVVKHTGDGVLAIFQGGQPLAAALDMQREMAAANWTPLDGLRIRVGLHAGQAQPYEGDYQGLAVNRAARVMDAAWGGQILFTPEVRAADALPDGAAVDDLGVHVLKDLAQPQPILGLTHPDLIAEFPPLRTVSAQPNNLPEQTTPFIGRDDELTDVAGLLGECRLVTLVGPGGMGKTRLGLQAAAAQIDTYRDGVYFVSLAPLSSSEFMVGTIADVAEDSASAS